MKFERNKECPCGSGKKYKRCCLTKNETASGFSGGDRRSVLEGLERFVDKELGAEDEEASALFCWKYEDREAGQKGACRAFELLR
jgi:hypothetical protein